jgi:hypothetical protein
MTVRFRSRLVVGRTTEGGQCVTALRKVAVESKRLGESASPHDLKARAVHDTWASPAGCQHCSNRREMHVVRDKFHRNDRQNTINEATYRADSGSVVQQ